jgi:hypothetical protein
LGRITKQPLLFYEHGVDGKEDPRGYIKTKVLGFEVLNSVGNKICSIALW